MRRYLFHDTYASSEPTNPAIRLLPFGSKLGTPELLGILRADLELGGEHHEQSHCDTRHSYVTASPGLHPSSNGPLTESQYDTGGVENTTNKPNFRRNSAAKRGDSDRVMVFLPSRPVRPRNPLSRAPEVCRVRFSGFQVTY